MNLIKLIHVSGECKIMITKRDIKKFLDKIEFTVKHIHSNPVLIPRNFGHSLHIINSCQPDLNNLDKHRAGKEVKA